MKATFTVILSLFVLAGFSQSIRYSNIIREDVRDINFEVIGKVGNNIQIYKNVRWKHMLAVYDENMHLISNSRMQFMPERTLNVDFMVYPGYTLMVYQYHKKSTIYCMAAKVDANGKRIGEPVILDTARIGLLTDRKIHGTVFSEDKSKILIYRMQKKNNSLHLKTLLYNKDLELQETSWSSLPFDDYRDVYSEMSVDNDGNAVFIHERRRANRDGVNALDVYVKQRGAPDAKIYKIPLSDVTIDEVSLKVDNLNKKYLLYSLYYDEPGGSISGVFTSRLDASTPAIGAFIPFNDSLRRTLSAKGVYRNAFDNMFIREIVVRKDGGFILNMEDYYSQSNNANSWNRFNYLTSSAYGGSNEYYMYNPAYRNYYRSYNNLLPVRYYYNDIAILSIDSNLQPEWSSVIHKKQVSDESDNFLSYSRMNQGSEIMYFFIENEKKNEVVTNHSVLPDGTVRRNGTLRGNEQGFEFMPRLAKQVSFRQMIIPAMYRGYVTFALVEI